MINYNRYTRPAIASGYDLGKPTAAEGRCAYPYTCPQVDSHVYTQACTHVDTYGYACLHRCRVTWPPIDNGRTLSNHIARNVKRNESNTKYHMSLPETNTRIKQSTPDSDSNYYTDRYTDHYTDRYADHYTDRYADHYTNPLYRPVIPTHSTDRYTAPFYRPLYRTILPTDIPNHST